MTIVVELETQVQQGKRKGWSPLSLFAPSADHQEYKDRIEALVPKATKKRSAAKKASSAEDGAQLQGEDQAVEEAQAEDGLAVDVEPSQSAQTFDYYNVINGFSIQAPKSLLDDIKAMRGVKNAFISEAHAAPLDAGETAGPKNKSSLDMTGSGSVAYTGKGQVIAIIDTGLKTDHEAFAGDLEDESVALTSDKVTQIKEQLSEGKDGVYVSEKIPFAYDYAMDDADVSDGSGHGTHVAGIAGANAGEVRGAAPDAQLVIMKVASDQGSIFDDALIAALDDASKFGLDAVNVSIGADGGFSGDAQDTLANAVNALEASGVVVNVAGGNSYSSAAGNLSGKNLPYATDPDSGTISSPASAAKATAVASANNEIGAPYFTTSEGDKIEWQGAQKQSDGSAWPTLDALPDGEYELFYDGDNEYQRYASSWLDGPKDKIRLVERGGTTPRGSNCSFGDKVRYTEGVLGLIVFDNEDADAPMKMLLDEWADYVSRQQPAVSVTKASGDKLKALAASGGKITIKAGQIMEPSKDYGVNDFSSWGVTPDLGLKPDITAPGGNIYSTTNDGKYAYMSGTSMATPQMTGISAQVAEYVEKDAKFASMSAAERKDAVTQLLMSTAKPLVDTATEGGYYSPRQQGSGIANVPAAIVTNVYATVDGAASAAHPKAELGESAEGTWTFTITLHNLGDAAATYVPDAIALSDQIADGLFQQHSLNYAGKGIDVAFSGAGYADGKVTVPAHGTAAYTVSITCTDAFKQAVAAAVNGTFVDGYATLKGQDGAVDLSVPFLGFYGDWGKAPIFDGKLGTKDAHLWGSYLETENIGYRGGPLGFNPLDSDAIIAYNNHNDRSKWEGSYHPDRLVVSNSADTLAPHSVSTHTFLTRGASDFMWGFSQKGAEEGIQAYSRAFLRKSRQNASVDGDPMLSAEAIAGGYAQFGFTGLDEGWYTVDEYAAVAGDDAEQQLGYEVYYDKSKPVITDVVNTEGDGAKVSFTVTDASWLAGISVQTKPVYVVSSSESIKTYLPEDLDIEESVDADGNRVYKVSIPISDLKDAWLAGSERNEENMPNTLALVAWDWGMNASEPATAVLNPVPAESIALSSDSVKLAPKQNKTLEATLAPADTTDVQVDWTSSDESVATVSADGKVTGIAVGTATVTAKVHGRDASASAKVTVKDLNAKTGVLLSDDVARVQNNGGEFDIKAALSPNLDGRSVNWASSDEDVFSIVPSADDPNAVTIVGGYQVGTAQISATIAEGGRIYTATAQVRNWPDDYEDFVIEDGTLVEYKGASLTVELPNDVKAVGESVFEGKRATEIRIPASVERIDAKAFLNTTASTVVFEDTEEHPSHLTTVGEQAFANTSNGQVGWSSFRFPESVTTLGKGVMEGKSCSQIYVPSSVTVIPDNAFTGTHDVIYIGDDVTSIGDHAFSAGGPQAMMFGALYIIGREAEQEELGDSLLPSKLQTIGAGAFQGTNVFVELTLPAGVKSIGDSAFSAMSQSIHNNGGPALVVNFNEGLESIGAGAFNGTRIEHIALPDSVTAVGAGAFSSIGNLKDFKVGKNVAAGALNGNFVYDDSITAFSADADCVNYTVKDGILYSKDMSTLVAYPMGSEPADVVVPEGVKTIASGAFDAYDGSFLDFCKNYPKSITLPDSIETIEKDAINTYVDTLDLGANVKEISENSFHDAYGYNGHNNDLNPAVPKHLVVRGGDGYTVAGTADVGYSATAYYGEGVKSVDYTNTRVNDIMVVDSSTLESFKYTSNWFPHWSQDPFAIYAKKGTQAYDTIKAALSDGTIDFGYWYDGWCVDDDENEAKYDGGRKAILHDYQALDASVSVDDYVRAGATVNTEARVSGGIDGKRSFRWFELSADGSKNYLTDWSDNAEYSWTVPDGTTQLCVEVRDASYITVVGTMAQAPEWTMQPADAIAAQGSDAAITAKAEVASGKGVVTYQWFKATKADMSDAVLANKGAAVSEDGVASLRIDTSKLGTWYYQVCATNTIEKYDLAEDSVSDVIAVQVLTAEEATLAESRESLAGGVDEAVATKQGDKSDAAYKALQEAAAAAKAVAENADATQADVDAAAQALADAVRVFNQSPTKDVVRAQQALNSAIAAAEKVDQSKLSDTRKRELASAIASARALAKKTDVSAAQLNTARSALAQATSAAQKEAAVSAEKEIPVVINIKTVNKKAVTAALKKANNADATTVVLDKKVKKVAKGAFTGTKVTTVIVKTKKLKGKSVKGAFKGSKVKTVQVQVGSAKVNKKSVKKYKKIFTKRIVGTKVTVK